MKIFGREPAKFLAALAVTVELVLGLKMDLSEAQHAAINGGATAALGLLLALSVSKEKVIAAAEGLLMAGVQVAVAFGANVSPDRVTLIATALTAWMAWYIREKVVAPTGSGDPALPGNKAA